MASVNLEQDHVLRGAFDKGIGDVAHCGICSITTKKHPSPWIICPRRILYLGGQPANQGDVFRRVFNLAGYRSGSMVAVWPEVSVRAESADGKKFQYAFDYIVRGMNGKNQPCGPPLIIENMTCSTSGGNRRRGTDIRTVFRKTALRQDADAPNVNIRQVWARMASQLIAKSEAAMEWDGQTIWIVQDRLMDYIRNTTGLKADSLRGNRLQEVNILSVGYGKAPRSGIRKLNRIVLYAGPIAPGKNRQPCFMDIVRAPYRPPLDSLSKALEGRSPVALKVP